MTEPGPAPGPAPPSVDGWFRLAPQVCDALGRAADARGLTPDAELDRILRAALHLRPGVTVFEVTLTAEAEVVAGNPEEGGR